MKLNEFIVTNKRQEVDNAFILNLAPVEEKEVFPFLPGQYCFLQNPKAKELEDLRPFSIASNPEQKRQLEFCIKIYGEWTQTFSKIESGEHLFVSEPQGKFFWDDAISSAVFLVGGLGISPIMAMLRHIAVVGKNPQLTLLYGNRTPETVIYKGELEALQNKLSNFRIVHIFSHLSEIDPWKGHRGFINGEIIRQEADLDKEPTFFIIGPPIFIDKMNQTLKELGVKPEHIRQELLSLNVGQTSRSESIEAIPV